MKNKYVVGIVALNVIATALQAATIYTPEAFSSRLGMINTSDLAATDIGSFDIPNGGFAPNAAFDTDGTLYAVVNWLADSRDHAHANLATIDTNTGKITEVGSHMDVNMVALEIDARGTIYGVGFNAPTVVPDPPLGLFGDTVLYEIDKATGQPTAIGETGINNLMDMSFRRSDGALFGTVADKLYTIDPDSGASELVTEITGVFEATGVEGAEIMGIMFDENDTLYATSFYGASQDYVSPLFTIDVSTGAATVVGNPGFVNPHGGDIMLPAPTLQAGDANQDLRFNQFDLIQVLSAAKYLTGEVATWGDGDWNGAPGGKPGQPPTGDGLFNQEDIVAAQQGGQYLLGRYAAVGQDGVSGDSQTSVGYDANTGQVWVDAPAGRELTSVNITSANEIFVGQRPVALDGAFDNFASGNVFKATFGGSFGSISFGNVASTGLTEEFVMGDLSVVGSLAGGGELGDVDLVYVPEPTSAVLLAAGFVMGILRFRR